MDLSKLSDADFLALQAGALNKMSDAGFSGLLDAQQKSLSKDQRAAQDKRIFDEKNNPTRGMSSFDLLAAGTGKAVTDAGRAIDQALPWSKTTRADIDETKRLDAPLMQTTPGRIGYGTGNAATGVLAMLAPGAGTVLGAGIYGGLHGALSPVGTDDSVVKNALIGSATAGGTTAAVNMLRGFAAPQASEAVKSLDNAGIVMTPGQRSGGGWKRAEDAMTSMPVIGDRIRTMQAGSFEDFNAAVANKALKHVADKLPQGVRGRDAIAYTERAIGDAYDGALRRMGTIKADQAFSQEVASLRQGAANSTMPKDVLSQFNKVLESQITGKFQGQSSMTAQTFKDAESELGRLATRYQADASVDKQLLGDALQEAQAALRRLAERAAGPDVAADVKAANAAWAEFKRIQRASSMIGAKEGVFTPENYLNAVKALDRSKDHSAFARGTALGQPFGTEAASVMGRTVPDSGTPFRSLISKPIEGAISTAIGSPLLGIYNRPVMNALQVLATGKRPALATKAAAELEMARPALAALGLTLGGPSARSSEK